MSNLGSILAIAMMMAERGHSEDLDKRGFAKNNTTTSNCNTHKTCKSCEKFKREDACPPVKVLRDAGYSVKRKKPTSKACEHYVKRKI